MLIAGFSIITACNSQKASSTEVFSSEYARLRVELPCKPVETSKDRYSYTAGERFAFEWQCDSGVLNYKVTYGDHNPDTPESIETFLNYSKGDLEFALRDQIRSKEYVSIDGRKGYKFRFSNGTILIALTANQRGVLHINMMRKDGKLLSEVDLNTFNQVLDSVKFSEK